MASEMYAHRSFAHPLFTAAMVGLALTACHRPLATPPTPSPSSSAGEYTPGLGEIMTFQQARHIKLWLAGQAGNWELAAYEVDELAEGFDDVLRFHPTFEEEEVAPKDAIPRMVVGPLSLLRSAIERKDAAAFAEAYDTLTDGCNGCHQALHHGFNVIERPTGNPYTNQVFERQGD